jgi:hypothetical protein
MDGHLQLAIKSGWARHPKTKIITSISENLTGRANNICWRRRGGPLGCRDGGENQTREAASEAAARKEPPDPGIRRLDVNVAASLWGSSAMTRIRIGRLPSTALSEIKAACLVVSARALKKCLSGFLRMKSRRSETGPEPAGYLRRSMDQTPAFPPANANASTVEPFGLGASIRG